MGEKHTPTPWKFSPWHIEEGPSAVRSPDGWIVANTSGDADAEFIVRAVNAYDDLVEVLKDIEAMVDNCPDVPRDPASLPMMVLAHVRAALSRHGEGK